MPIIRAKRPAILATLDGWLVPIDVLEETPEGYRVREIDTRYARKQKTVLKTETDRKLFFSDTPMDSILEWIHTNDLPDEEDMENDRT